ncbi:MAG: restriction endonuclease [Candidatus Binataceae bacterium]
MDIHGEIASIVRDSTVSRRHAQIKLVNGIWQIEDLDSTNGTRVNGEYIRGPRQLRDSDRIALGKIWFRFSQQPVTGHPAPHHLGLLTPQEFEELIAELLAAEGFTNVMVTGRPGDGGIDIAASTDRAFSQGRYVVQCKRYYNQRVSPLEVQAFHGAIAADPAARGAFVTTSSFTKGARKFAAGVGMGLVDGEQLVILLTRHSLWPF